MLIDDPLSECFNPASPPSISTQHSLQNKLHALITVTALFNAIHARHERRPFIPLDVWHWSHQSPINFELRDVSSTLTDKASLEFRIPHLKIVLTCIPQVINFSDRLSVLYAYIAEDRASLEGRDNSFFSMRATRLRLRRDHLVDDAFTKLGELDSTTLKRRVQVCMYVCVIACAMHAFSVLSSFYCH